jgi:hypothetical protein
VVQQCSQQGAEENRTVLALTLTIGRIELRRDRYNPLDVDAITNTPTSEHLLRRRDGNPVIPVKFIYIIQ